MRFIDLTGAKFSRLTVLGLSGEKTKSNHHLLLCKCDCGNIIKTTNSSLKVGNTKSCGCYHSEQTSKAKKTHADCRSKEYATWANIKNRCTNPNNTHFKHYGGRGITMCDRWLVSYEAFLDDMGRSPSPLMSIDRINTNGNYEKGNCKWATAEEQANNKRTTIRIPHEGGIITVSQLCKIANVKRHIFAQLYYINKLPLETIKDQLLCR